ncbi:hypothetical protein LTR84_004849 [Exophiala bonariae]|uniref:HAUS augmin-like complex subunit 6 N-terminal domain-containing protein n=1 Tax=Exophiala bonariae TaxID=1690606 RepID=A0AAV9NQT6_9EURO|nr:hypothetical protein LTR84_004849 [Exophiala bonariae]
MDKQWKPRSSIAVFVSALHLLDLDNLKDWPSFTISTFQSKSTSQTLQAKIKATEWALYHLFQIYSPDSTRQVLNPNFPPKTPIQSLNLRAGLFKLLTELKKNALLPRETILRKTMLDECKGDKYEDLLAAFAMLVLRKVLLERKGTAVATSSSAKPENVVPLIIAHHVSLQSKLRQRETMRGEARDHANSLEAKRMDLASRLQALSAPEELDDRKSSQADDNVLREKVVDTFAAHPQWAKFLFDGDVHEASTPVGSSGTSPFQQENQPMSHLRSLLSQQKTRIQHLEDLQASLLSDDPGQPTVIPFDHPKQVQRGNFPANAASILRFDKHKAINLNSTPV